MSLVSQRYFQDRIDQPRADVGDILRAARRVYIKARDLENHGYTSGCPRCEHEMKYGKGRTTLPHSERCRQRIMEELAKTDEGQRRIAEAGARLDRALVDMGEAIFREEQPAAQGEIAASSSVRAQVDSESARNPFSVDEPSESVIPDPVVEMPRESVIPDPVVEMPRDIVDDDAAIREAASRELDDAIRAGSSMELDVGCCSD